MKKKPISKKKKIVKSYRASKTIQEIFAEEKLSKRFHINQKNGSRHGKSLYLNLILGMLKKEFPDFKIPLDNCITRVRDIGSSNPEVNRKKVIKSLRMYASTLSEISEETRLSKTDVNKILVDLEKKEIVYKTHPIPEYTKQGKVDPRYCNWFLK